MYNSLSDSDDSARDIEGHGSHTASTAPGNKINGVSFYGIAEGNARGGVPSTRIAAYKVCFDSRCLEADILAGFDNAISDGVDFISISIGSVSAKDLTEDSIAIGSFHAMTKGILTLNGAGNEGPQTSSASSVAPWMVSVAASTTDRQIITTVVLGDGTTAPVCITIKSKSLIFHLNKSLINPIQTSLISMQINRVVQLILLC